MRGSVVGNEKAADSSRTVAFRVGAPTIRGNGRSAGGGRDVAVGHLVTVMNNFSHHRSPVVKDWWTEQNGRTTPS